MNHLTNKSLTQSINKIADLQGKLTTQYSHISDLLQRYFEYDISIVYGEGDGLVIVWEEDIPCTAFLEDAIKNINLDPNYYKE